MPLLAPGIGPLGIPELLIIAFIVVLIFGVGRLPEVGGAVGKSIKEFRKSTKDDDGDETVSNSATPAVESAGAAGAAPAPPARPPPPACGLPSCTGRRGRTTPRLRSSSSARSSARSALSDCISARFPSWQS